MCLSIGSVSEWGSNITLKHHLCYLTTEKSVLMLIKVTIKISLYLDFNKILGFILNHYFSLTNCT